MPVNPLSDGTPLTFEWLNSVAEAINRLEIQNADDSNVKFVGDVNGQDVQIETGTATVNATKGVKAIESQVAFKTPFRDNSVTVVAMVTTKDKKPIAAGIAVGQITSKKFNLVIDLFDDSAAFGKNQKVFVKYVAIGKKQARS